MPYINEKVKMLKEKYQVSDQDLLKIGLIKEKHVVLCGQLTKDEKEKLSKIAYKKDTDMSTLMREEVTKIITNEKEIKIIKDKSQKKDNPLTFNINEREAKKFRKICNKNNIPLSSAVRYLVKEIIKREEEN